MTRACPVLSCLLRIQQTGGFSGLLNPSAKIRFLFHLNLIILDIKDAEASDEAGDPAEPVLLDVKGREGFFQLIKDNAQVVYMAVIAADNAADLLSDFLLGGAGAFFLNKVTAVKPYHLKIIVIQAF